MAGSVNNQAVICVINNAESFCNRSNTLFTLRENAKEDEVMQVGNFLGRLVVLQFQNRMG